MNRIFKVIYNNAKHCYVVACEFAKSYSRGGSLTRTAKRAGKVVAVAVLGASLVFSPIITSAENSGGTTEGHPTQYIGNNGSIDNVVIFNENPNNTITEVYGGKTDSYDADDNNVTISGDVILQSVYGGYVNGYGKATGNKVTINGGDFSNATIYGGYVNGSGDATHNKVTINGGDFSNATIYGGYVNGSSNATDNTVTIKGGDFSNADIYGGYIENGTGDCVSGNELVINNDITVKNIHNFNIVSGESISASGDVSAKDIRVFYLKATNITATGNVKAYYISATGDVIASNITATDDVEAANITATGDVTAGSITTNTLTATNQTLTLTGTGSQIGTTDLGFGTLIVNSNAGGNVGSLEAKTVTINGNVSVAKINNLNTLSVSNGKLTLGQSSDLSPSTVTLADDGVVETSVGALTVGDVSGTGTLQGKDGVVLMTGINSTSLTLVAETGDITSSNNISAKSLTATEGNIDVTGKSITAERVTAKNSLTAEKLTLKGNGSKIGTANINNITVDAVEWSNTIPVLSAESFKYNDSTELGGNVTLDISNMTINGENPTGSMTLLQSDKAENFSGLKLKFSDSEAVVIPDTGKVIKSTATNQTKETKGVFFTYDRNQSVFMADNNKKVNYVFADTYKKAELGSMKWSDGGYSFSGNEAIDSIGLVVTFADSFNVEGAEAKNEGDSLDLLDLSNVAGAGKIKDSINETITLTLDDENPTSDMIFSLNRNDSIKTNTDKTKLTYTIGTKNVTKITLDSITADDSRDMSETSYNFSNLASIDASKLEFTFNNDQVAALSNTSSLSLLTKASDLPANIDVIYKDDIAEHTQAIDYSLENGIALLGTLSGTLSTSDNTVNYSVNGISLDEINLANWDSPKEASTVLDGWSTKSDGVMITATTFNPTMTTGEKTILTASNDIFKDENIDEAIRYANNGTFDNDSDKGVILAGNKIGGVKASDDGKSLTYYALNKDVTSISLGSLKWGEGRTIDSDWIYDFKNVNKIDTKELKFELSNEQTATLAKGSSMELLSNAADLPDGVQVTYNDNATFQSQSIDYNTSNGVLMLGTLSGTVTTSDETVNYSVSGISLDEVNIANWDDTKDVSTVLEGWEANSNGIKITAETFAPTLTTGEKTILTASSDIFKNENIDEAIRYANNGIFDNDSDKGVTLAGNKFGGVKASDDGKSLTYYALNKDVTSISLGSISWGEGRSFSSNGGYDFKNVNKIDASGLSFSNPEVVTGAMELVAGAKNLGAGTAVTGGRHTQKFDSMLDNKAVVYATMNGEVSVEAEKVKYALNGININKFELAKWDGENASSVNSSWKVAKGATVETDGMSNLPDSDSEKEVFILKSDKDNFFADVAINGENAYGKKQNNFTESDEAQSVIIAGTQDKGVTLDSSKKNLVYKFGSKEVTSFKLASVNWEEGAELLNRDKYNYSKLTSIDTKDFNISYEKPETVAVNQSMTLLKANDTLKDIAATENSLAYQYEPVSGVTMDAVIRSSLEARSGKVTLSAISNKADKLTFGHVDWLEKGALIDHKTMLNNVSFDGASVDTSKIAFINKEKLSAGMKMTLVSDFDGAPGAITGSKYKVGTAYEGEGSAYMDGNDLVFKTKTAAGLSDETHTTVMAMEAGVAMLAAGNEHVGNAIEGLGNAANAGSDGVSTYASVGGSSSRYETGSHVDTNSWNCTLAVGKTLEKRDGSFEYGLFAEYGRGNYTLHMDGVDNAGSGRTHYTGGGLLMKWTNSHNVYTEASFRMGNMKDKASSLLHDGLGNAYGYDVSAKYRGGHFGIGKTLKENDDTKLDIYGKYFYNQREGINFAAGADQYSLDEVRSRVLRAGFRLSSTDKQWNRYGGISYDYEFGGKANGTVNGNAVRAASIKGGTLRGEFGYCREATKTNPWKTDISLYGFTGKRNGFGGSVAFEYHF